MRAMEAATTTFDKLIKVSPYWLAMDDALKNADLDRLNHPEAQDFAEVIQNINWESIVAPAACIIMESPPGNRGLVYEHLRQVMMQYKNVLIVDEFLKALALKLSEGLPNGDDQNNLLFNDLLGYFHYLLRSNAELPLDPNKILEADGNRSLKSAAASILLKLSDPELQKKALQEMLHAINLYCYYLQDSKMEIEAKKVSEKLGCARQGSTQKKLNELLIERDSQIRAFIKATILDLAKQVDDFNDSMAAQPDQCDSPVGPAIPIPSQSGTQVKGIDVATSTAVTRAIGDKV